MAEDRVGREGAESAFSWIDLQRVSIHLRVVVDQSPRGTKSTNAPAGHLLLQISAQYMLWEHPARAECNNPMEPLRCDPVNSSKGNRITACAGCWWSAAQRHWFPPVTVQAAPLPAAQVIGSNSPNRDQVHATRAARMDPGRSCLTTAPQQPAHEHSPRTQSSHTCSHPADERHRALCA